MSETLHEEFLESSQFARRMLSDQLEHALSHNKDVRAQLAAANEDADRLAEALERCMPHSKFAGDGYGQAKDALKLHNERKDKK